MDLFANIDTRCWVIAGFNGTFVGEDGKLVLLFQQAKLGTFEEMKNIHSGLKEDIKNSLP